MGYCDLSFIGSGLAYRTEQTGNRIGHYHGLHFFLSDGTPKGYITSFSINPPRGQARGVKSLAQRRKKGSQNCEMYRRLN